MIYNRFKRLFVVLALACFGFILLFGVGLPKQGLLRLPLAHAGFFNHDLDSFEDILELVAEKYVYPPDYKKMFSHAINGMVEKLEAKNLFVETHGSQKVFSIKDKHLQIRLGYNQKDNMKAFKKAFYFLFENFSLKVTKRDLEKAAIEGMVSALDDYSLYLDKKAFEQSIKDTEGKYGGLGMVITMRDYKLVVVKTMKNSPARRAGILPEDIIIEVNGEEIKEMQIQELAERLRGYPNTKVSLALLRPSDNIRRPYTLTREIIMIETVVYKFVNKHTGYIQISSFSQQTEDQLNEALQKAKNDRVKSIILDLRNNPGGLLTQSVRVASHFIPKERLIVYTQGRQKSDRQKYLAAHSHPLDNLPIVVLINSFSASASEIVSGSLRDSGNALIVGQNSYGKGSVQTIFKISDGSGLRLTTSKYYTPSGIDITEHGIAPDINIQKDLLSEEEKKKDPSTDLPEKVPPPGFQQVHLKESELKSYLKGKSVAEKEIEDPVVLFAALVLKDAIKANKEKSLNKARDLANTIHFKQVQTEKM